MPGDTLYLNKTNFGIWAIYRKKCFSKVENNSEFCKKLHKALFSKTTLLSEKKNNF